MKRGDIWWVELGEPRGSEPAFRRPVVVVQDDFLTASELSTVMVAPITSNLRRGLALGNVQLEPKGSGLSRQSVVLTCQLMTIDKSWFEERVGSLSQRQIEALDTGLKLALGLRH